MRSSVVSAAALCGFSMATLAACGGGGGGGGAAPTPTPSRPDVLYVRASGDDGNDGTSPAQAVRDIQTAVLRATEGDMIIVGPGNYGRVTFDRKGGVADNPIVLDADPSGAMTGDAAGPVRIQVDEGLFAIRLTQSPYIIIDGFTLGGATADNGAGIIVRSSSHNTTIRNCEIMGNRDGVRVQDSDDLLLVNNLIVDNSNRGTLIGASGNGPGSQRAQLINNTIVRNGGAGIFIGNNDVASKDAVVRNNIIQDNAGRNFDVDDGPPSSVEGLSADFNLVFKTIATPECTSEAPQSACGYGPLALRGESDVNADAQFDDPSSNNFLLNQRDSPAVDAGDPDLESLVGGVLEQRTTAPRGIVDELPFDLGYHYPQPES